jgi:nucleoside-diphosphate-sugar epimerase
MRVIVVGDSGVIGSTVVLDLQDKGHEVMAAPPTSGVPTLTIEVLAEVLEGPAAVVDVSNAPSFQVGFRA